MSVRVLAVCLHDVQPQTLERCRFIRRWLAARGVERMTLLAIPCAYGSALTAEDACATWLREAAAADAVAQHGLHHQRSQQAGRARDWLADRQGGAAAEFVGLTYAQTVAAVGEGRALLAAAGLHPRGFVAPAYAYNAALRRELRQCFDWYGGLFALHGRRRLYAPAQGLGTSTRFKRRTSPLWLRLGARLPGSVLRLDVHPADFEFPGHVDALDTALRQSAFRSVSYDDLAG